MNPRLVLPVHEHRDHIRGPVGAPITVLEYGDYECPLCAAAHPIVGAIRLTLGRHVRFVFRHFPRPQDGRRAERAAQAAEAAAAQGEFWEMHDMLFENQDALEDDDLLLYAADIGIDAGRVAHELAAGVHSQRVREDVMTGMQSGVNATPAFFINGVRHAGAIDTESLLQGIERVALAYPSAR
jgi:protein-disulfide isomerase